VGVSQTAALNRGRHLYSAGRPSRWALAHISSFSWSTTHTKCNEAVGRHTDQSPLTLIIRTTRFKFFGHIVRSDPSMDHGRALRASMAQGPFAKVLNRRSGRPRYTWLRTVESDLAPLIVGLATACHRVQIRQAWRTLAEHCVRWGPSPPEWALPPNLWPMSVVAKWSPI